MATKLLLSDPGKFPLAGPERGQKVFDGISRYVSPHGSYRYVRYVDGVAVAALQVMSRDGKYGQAANVYTHPEFRRQGYATELWRQAQRDFKKLVQAPESDRSQAGVAWSQAIRSGSMSLQSRIIKLAYENPKLRADLLPLLKVGAWKNDALKDKFKKDVVDKVEELRKGIAEDGPSIARFRKKREDLQKETGDEYDRYKERIDAEVKGAEKKLLADFKENYRNDDVDETFGPDKWKDKGGVGAAFEAYKKDPDSYYKSDLGDFVSLRGPAEEIWSNNISRDDHVEYWTNEDLGKKYNMDAVEKAEKELTGLVKQLKKIPGFEDVGDFQDAQDRIEEQQPKLEKALTAGLPEEYKKWEEGAKKDLDTKASRKKEVESIKKKIEEAKDSFSSDVWKPYAKFFGPEAGSYYSDVQEFRQWDKHLEPALEKLERELDTYVNKGGDLGEITKKVDAEIDNVSEFVDGLTKPVAERREYDRKVRERAGDKPKRKKEVADLQKELEDLEKEIPKAESYVKAYQTYFKKLPAGVWDDVGSAKESIRKMQDKIENYIEVGDLDGDSIDSLKKGLGSTAKEFTKKIDGVNKKVVKKVDDKTKQRKEEESEKAQGKYKGQLAKVKPEDIFSESMDTFYQGLTNKVVQNSGANRRDLENIFKSMGGKDVPKASQYKAFVEKFFDVEGFQTDNRDIVKVKAKKGLPKLNLQFETGRKGENPVAYVNKKRQDFDWKKPHTFLKGISQKDMEGFAKGIMGGGGSGGDGGTGSFGQFVDKQNEAGGFKNPNFGKSPGAKEKVKFKTLPKDDQLKVRKQWEKSNKKKAAMESVMLNSMTRLAHSNPDLRPTLMPIIAQHSLIRLAMRGSPMILEFVKLGYIAPQDLMGKIKQFRAELEEGIKYWRESGATSEADAAMTALKQLESGIQSISTKVNQQPTTKDDRGKKINTTRFLAEHGDDTVTIDGKKIKFKSLQGTRSPKLKKKYKAEFDKRYKTWRKKEEKARDKAQGKSPRKPLPNKPVKYASALACVSGDLRATLIKLTHQKPSMRPYLLPIITAAANPFAKTPKSIGDFKLTEKGKKGERQEFTWTHKDDPGHQITMAVTPGKSHSEFKLTEKTPSGRVKNLGNERRRNDDVGSVMREYVSKAEKAVGSAVADRGGWEKYIKGKKFHNPKTNNDVGFYSLPADLQKKERSKWDHGRVKSASAEKLVKRFMALVKDKKKPEDIVSTLAEDGHTWKEINDLVKIVGGIKKNLSKKASFTYEERKKMREQQHHMLDTAPEYKKHPVWKAVEKLTLHGEAVEDFFVTLPQRLVSMLERAVTGKKTKDELEKDKSVDLDKDVPSPKDPTKKIKLRTLRDNYPEDYAKYTKKGLSLRDKLVKIAYDNPDLRPDLLPLLKKAITTEGGGLEGDIRKDFEQKYNLLADTEKELGGKLKKVRPLYEAFQKKIDSVGSAFSKAREEVIQKHDEIKRGLHKEYEDAQDEYEAAYDEWEDKFKKKNKGLWTGLTTKQEAEIEDDLEERFKKHKNPAMDAVLREIPKAEYISDDIERDFTPAEHWKGKPHYQLLFQGRRPGSWAFRHYQKEDWIKDHIKEELGGNKKFLKGLDFSDTGMSPESVFEDMGKFKGELRELNTTLKKVPGFKYQSTTDPIKLMDNLSKSFQKLPELKKALEGGELSKDVQKFVEKHPSKKKQKEAPKKKKTPKKKTDPELLKTKTPNPDYGKKPGAPKDITLNTLKKKENAGDAPKGLFKRIWDKLTGKGKKAHNLLNTSLIKIAYDNPDLRADILPFLQSNNNEVIQ